MLKNQWNRFVNAHELYPMLRNLGLMKGKTHIVDEGFGPTRVTGDNITTFGDVILEATPKGKRASHDISTPRRPKSAMPNRIFVHCTCGLKMPFGRMNQHMKGPYHRPAADGNVKMPKLPVEAAKPADWGLPEGVQVLGLDDVAAMHNAIAKAVGEPQYLRAQPDEDYEPWPVNEDGPVGEGEREEALNDRLASERYKD